MAEIYAREQKEVPVLGENHTITKFPATRGLRYQKYLLKVLGPAYIESQSSEDVTLAQVLAKVVDRLDEIDEEVLKSMVVESLGMSPSKFEHMFSGQSVALYKLLKEIVFFNYQDVFTLLGLEELPEQSPAMV